ncbi:MAG: hypothetical protein M1820_001513 [Bogoriella megaspora]|nr:MAG: hypothetical protein M1820_001513 [Bogoriella megaspora]
MSQVAKVRKARKKLEYHLARLRGDLLSSEASGALEILMSVSDRFPAAPPGPPPLLSEGQVLQLLEQGFLFLPLLGSLQLKIRDLSKLIGQFFDRSEDRKKKLYPATRGTENGYYPVAGEKEYVTFRYRVGALPELENQVAEVWKAIATLLHRILCDIARGSEIPLSSWDQLLQDSLTLPEGAESLETSTTLLRLFRYYPDGGFADKHNDIGLLTLCVGDGAGLQVLDNSTEPPQWKDVEGPTILVGEMLRVLSHGMIRAGPHRVVANEKGRTSTVFALRPSLKGMIDLTQFGFEGEVDAKQLWGAIKGGKVNINATKDTRERMQTNLDAKKGKEKAGTAENENEPKQA